jgi:two-component sensor histidine kinase
MSEKRASSTSFDVDTERVDFEFDVGRAGQMSRELTCENIRLQQLLKHADEAATRFGMMLREGDHRIKNSLQIVASIVDLQARRESNKTAQEVLRAAAARIQSVASIHDALQAGCGQDTVDLGEVLSKMCESLHAMAGDPLKVAVVVSAEKVRTSAAFAQAIVLAVNELVVNALRHAFPGNRTGVIQVSVAQVNGDLRVVVADDGLGLPLNYAQGPGYGMKLVRMMVDQTGGTLYIDGSSGARFTLVAPARPAAGA